MAKSVCRFYYHGSIIKLNQLFQMSFSKKRFNEYSTWRYKLFTGDHHRVYCVMVKVNLLVWKGSCNITFLEEY